MRLDVRKTDALLAIVETGSFELAAVRLRLTNSAISQRIRSLETQLGVPLIVRGRPCRSTREGKKLVQFLRRERLLAEEFESEFTEDGSAPMRIPIAINNDTLGTWLLPALAEFITKENVLVDILIDDQDFTHKAIEEGVAIAAVSSRNSAMRGCTVEHLGAIRYRMLASPVFYKRWFKNGVTRDSILNAPLLVFDRKDTLQSDFIALHFGVRQENCNCHFIPSTEAFLTAVKLGIGYGMIPELHYKDLIKTGVVVDIVPGRYTDIQLYWHHWKVQSPRVDKLTSCIIEEAAKLLTVTTD